MGDNPEIYSKKLVRVHYPDTVTMKGTTVKTPTKTVMKGKVVTSKKAPMVSKGVPKMGKLPRQTAMQMKKC